MVGHTGHPERARCHDSAVFVACTAVNPAPALALQPGVCSPARGSHHGGVAFGNGCSRPVAGVCPAMARVGALPPSWLTGMCRWDHVQPRQLTCVYKRVCMCVECVRPPRSGPAGWRGQVSLFNVQKGKPRQAELQSWGWPGPGIGRKLAFGAGDPRGAAPARTRSFPLPAACPVRLDRQRPLLLPPLSISVWMRSSPGRSGLSLVVLPSAAPGVTTCLVFAPRVLTAEAHGGRWWLTLQLCWGRLGCKGKPLPPAGPRGPPAGLQACPGPQALGPLPAPGSPARTVQHVPAVALHEQDPVG